MRSESFRQAERPIKVIRPIRFSLGNLLSDLRSLCRHRGLFFEMTLLRLKVRYRQSLLGWVWAVLPPVLLMIAYMFVFSKVVGLQTENLPYSLFSFSGLIPWMFFSNSVSTATSGIVTHRYLISRVAFPREIIPLSYVAAAVVELGLGLLMLAAVMFYFDVRPTRYVFYAIPILIMLAICAVAAAFVCASLQARFRDIGMAMPLMLQVLMFTAPVVYSSQSLPNEIRNIYFFNPLAILIEALRHSVVTGVWPTESYLIYCAVVSCVSVIAAYALFKRLDATLADVI
jgi:lipopolysaccharide transport system permease protein